VLVTVNAIETRFNKGVKKNDGQNASMFHQLLYVRSLSVIVRDKILVNGEQKLVNIGS